MESVDPNKYVVFKRDEFMKFMEPRAMNFATAEIIFDELQKASLADAVVIRRQDLFAGPALHSYANNMAMAARMVSEGDEQKRLLGIADYFHDQATQADAEGWKLPD